MHIIWDWNGTLLDDFAVILDAVNVSLAEVGESEITADDYRRHFTRPIRDFYVGLLGREVDDSFMDRVNDRFFSAYIEGFPAARLTSDAAAALADVDERGSTQSVASMAPHDVLVSTITRFRVADWMLAVDGHRGVVGETKAEHLREHVTRLLELHDGLSRDGMIVIGDTLDDAAAAVDAGVGCVLYDGGSHLRADLEAVGVPVAATLVEAVAVALPG